MAQQPRSTSSPSLNPPSHSPSPRPTTSSSNNDNDSIQNAASGEEAEEGADLPLTLAASVILDALPRDAHKALETAGELRDAKGEIRKKVKVRLTPLANTPSLKQPVFMCSASQKFAYIANFLRNRLKIAEGQGVHCYVNSVFAPALDEGVGGLWSCFKTGEELVVSYSLAQAFG